MSQEDIQHVHDPSLLPITKGEFVFRFKQHGKDHVVKVPVAIPLPTTVKELAYRIIGCHSIACYVEDGKLNKSVHYTRRRDGLVVRSFNTCSQG